MILALAQVKGGSSKTTVAIHLAAALARRDPRARVELLDGDPQRAALQWADRGALPFTVRPATDGATPNADFVVVDTAAGEATADLEALARAADRLVVPARPSPLDLLATFTTLDALEGANPVVLLTMCPPAPQRDALEARALLEDAGARVLATEVPHRKAYQLAALEGSTVLEVPRVGAALWPAWPALLREVNA